MPLCLNLLRRDLHYRREAFSEGATAAGLSVVEAMPRSPAPEDVLLIWNRYGSFSARADEFEARGATVIVVENCAMGNSWRPGKWFCLARSHVALTGGDFRPQGPSRWAEIGCELEPFRGGGDETVILAQRGIGHPTVASPERWAESVRGRFGGRIRPHPGASSGETPSLREDLARAREVITWSSAAAVQALAMGVPVWHRHENFVMAPAALPLSMFGRVPPERDEAKRLSAFERLAWAMWELDEVRSGEPIRRLL